MGLSRLFNPEVSISIVKSFMLRKAGAAYLLTNLCQHVFLISCFHKILSELYTFKLSVHYIFYLLLYLFYLIKYIIHIKRLTHCFKLRMSQFFNVKFDENVYNCHP